MKSPIVIAAVTIAVLAAVPVIAGDRLQWTGAVTEVEGAAGGGVVPWALIGGLETDDQFGATAFATYVTTSDFSLRSGGLGVDYGDRIELAFARQRFDAGSVSPGLTLGQDIVGLKVRLVGDAVFAPDQYLPQIALGAEWKRTLDFDQIPRPSHSLILDSSISIAVVDDGLHVLVAQPLTESNLPHRPRRDTWPYRAGSRPTG